MMHKRFFAIIVSLIIGGTLFTLVKADSEPNLLPHWLEKNIHWWNQGEISHSEFVNGITWLMEKKLIESPSQVPEWKPNLNKLEEFEKTDSSFAPKIIKNCGNDVHCAVDELQILSKIEEKNSVLDTYYELLEYFRNENFSCHPSGHPLGEFFSGYLGNVTLAISFNDPIMCGGSIYHGIIMNFMRTKLLFNNMEPLDVEILKICPQDFDENPTITRWECIHGVGHGLTILYQYDVFSAVKRCDEFEKDWEKVSCSKGLFMENVNSFYDADIGTMDKSDHFFPCNQLEERYAPPCYHYQARHILNLNNQIYNEAFEDCKQIPDEFEKYCYRGLGNKMANHVFHYGFRFQDCSEAANYQSDCYKGIVMLLADNRNLDEALEFCDKIPTEFKEGCFGEVGKWITMVYSDPKERVSACLKSNSEYFGACMSVSFNNLKML